MLTFAIYMNLACINSDFDTKCKPPCIFFTPGYNVRVNCSTRTSP